MPFYFGSVYILGRDCIVCVNVKSTVLLTHYNKTKRMEKSLLDNGQCTHVVGIKPCMRVGLSFINFILMLSCYG